MVTMTRPILGSETEAFGSDPSSDKSYHFRYKVLELDDLVTSHKTDLTLNPHYPKELQPRIRDRAASRIQIEGMAQHLNPRVLLHDSGFIDTGPMIVGSDNVVESGNGRSLALMVASQESPENYARYKSMLETLADKYGFTKSQISSMSHPVLVRERIGDTDRVKFANEANVGAVMGMSPYEQALQDSKRLSAEVVGGLEVSEEQTIDQALRARSNDFIIQHFVSQVPANERATIADDKGQINSQGLQRLRLALFAKTYTGSAGEKLTRIFGESADPYVKQIETAMFSTLPDMAKAGGLVSSGARAKDLDVAPDIAEVVDTYASLKAQGLSVQDYLKQSQMFDERLTPFQKQLLEHLDDIGRKSKTLREFFRETAERIIASPPPGQGSLLGDARLSKEEVLNAIINNQRKELGKPAIGLAPSLSRSKELAQADTPRTPGPIGVGSEVGSHEPKASPVVQAGPVLSRGASVQVGLSGFGPSHAQVKMLEEFGTAPGAGGQKHQLIDEEALKAKEEAKPLKGQMGLEGGIVGEKREKYPDGRTKPRQGDRVYTHTAGALGTEAVLEGEVVQHRGQLAVKIERASGMLTTGSSVKYVAFTPSWTLHSEDDPHLIAVAKGRKETEEYHAKVKAETEALEKLVETSKAKGNVHLDQLEPQIGMMVKDVQTGETGVIAELDNKPKERIYVHWGNDPEGMGGRSVNPRYVILEKRPEPALSKVEGKAMPEFQVDEMVIWHSPHSGTDVEMNYRGRMGDKAMLYNPKSGFQTQVPVAQLSRMKASMDTMVSEARKWQGAAFEADSLYEKDAKKERLAHSRMTTKADLDAYLMRKFGLSETEARDVSNELTHKNLKPDTNAALMDYKDEPWAKAAMAYDEATVAAPQKPEASREFTMQNGRTHVEIMAKYEVGGKPQQNFKVNGEWVIGLRELEQKYPPVYAKVISDYTDLQPSLSKAPMTPEQQAEHKAHLMGLAKAYDEKHPIRSTITDVTPEGYGPGPETPDSYSTHAADKHLTTEEAQRLTSINEAKTILKGDISGEKREAVERSLSKAEGKPFAGTVHALKLRDKLAHVEAKLSRVGGSQEAHGRTYIPEGEIGGVRSMSRKRKDQRMDKTIRLATEYVDLKKTADHLRGEIEAFEEGRITESGRHVHTPAELQAKQTHQERMMGQLQVGDSIELWTGNTVKIAKVNKKSVVSEGGVKWAPNEIIRVIKAEPPKGESFKRTEEPKGKTSLLNKEPPGGWTEADKVPDKYRKHPATKGQSYEHAQVHPSVVNVEDTPEENMRAAELFEKRRKELSQQKDESQTHNRTIKPQNLTSKRLRAWKRRPGGSDIRGVDSKTIGRMR